MALVIPPPVIEAASTLAVIASSNEPLLFLAADLTVIAASASFCRAFQIDSDSVSGRPLADLGAGEWALPQLSSLLRATASGSAQIESYEIDLLRKDHVSRCLVLNARKLDDGNSDRVRLLLAITDVTLARAEARQKDDLIREKAILLECNIGSPTVSRSLRACSCRAPVRCNPRKPGDTFGTPTTESCRSPLFSVTSPHRRLVMWRCVRI
jgi:hypothetical protein